MKHLKIPGKNKTGFMRYGLIILLVIFNAAAAIAKKPASDDPLLARKHHVYADVGISLSQLKPGFSVAYNYRPVKAIGVGIGVQGYPFFPTISNDHQFVPGVVGDLRLNIFPAKKNQAFVLLDIGVDFYKHTNRYGYHDNSIYYVTKNNGTFVGLGLGYFRRITKQGGGIYTSVKLFTNNYAAHKLDLITQKEENVITGRGTMAVSFGFKF